MDQPSRLFDLSLEIELKELARGNARAHFMDGRGIKACVGAVPGAVVYATRLELERADRAIADQLDLFDDEALGVTWWAGPNDNPKDLRKRLLNSGFILEDDEAAMALKSRISSRTIPYPPDWRSRRLAATSASMLGSWTLGSKSHRQLTTGRMSVNCRSAHVTYSIGDALYPGAMSLHTSMPGRCRLPGCCSEERVAMLHGVVNSPESRRRGIGTGVTCRALEIARAEGCELAVLHASSLGQGPYERLGFKRLSWYGRYVRLSQLRSVEARKDVPETAR